MCKITEQSRANINKQAVTDAEADVSRLREAPVAVKAVVGGVSGTTATIVEEDVVAWEPVFASIQAFAGLVKDLSKVRLDFPAVLVACSYICTDTSVRSRCDDGPLGGTNGKCIMLFRCAVDFNHEADDQQSNQD